MEIFLGLLATVLFVVIPAWIFVHAVRGFVTDTRRRAHNRDRANRRFRDQQRRERDERRQARRR